MRMPNTLFLVLFTLVACGGGGGGGASGASSVSSSSSSASSSVSSISAPAAPTGVTAAAGNTTVDLSWTASSGATSYHVKRGSTAGGPYTQLSAPTTTSYSDTGLTNGNTYYYVVTALNAGGESGNSSEVSAQPAASVPNVVVTVDATTTKPISPYIYGINFYSPGDPAQLTLSRMGGNRWTAYNWENNASNAGNDYIYSSDSFLGGGSTPAESVRSAIAANQAAGQASLFTVQLQGYVSADKNGAVDMTLPLATRLATRFKPVVNKKSAAFTLTPDASDASVYMDEFVWALDQKLSSSQMFAANAALPSFISLDNEPELWQSTHEEIQGKTLVTSDNYIAKTIDLCKAIKDQFPNATIFGPAHYGFAGIYSWQGELAPTPGGSNWFPDKYLLAMKNAATTYGRRLLDVYDFHWYPEVYDANGMRIVGMDGSTLTDAQVQLIVQSPRDLWDPTFHDPNNSNPWVYQTLGSTPINIIGRLQAKIAATYPGTKLALTEYQNGGGGHIAGTIAQADDLGIFGAQGVFAATYWPTGNAHPYVLAGFRAFRGFDGANANFGDTSLKATSADVQNVMVYVSADSNNAARRVIVAINRSTATRTATINGLGISTGTATTYRMTAASAQTQLPGAIRPVLIGQAALTSSTVVLTLPALSVTTVEIK